MNFRKRENKSHLCYSCGKCLGYERAKLGISGEVVSDCNFKCDGYKTVFNNVITSCPMHEDDGLIGIIAKFKGIRTIIRGKEYTDLSKMLKE